jgi:hypothetical protein
MCPLKGGRFNITFKNSQRMLPQLAYYLLKITIKHNNLTLSLNKYICSNLNFLKDCCEQIGNDAFYYVTVGSTLSFRDISMGETAVRLRRKCGGGKIPH